MDVRVEPRALPARNQSQTTAQSPPAGAGRQMDQDPTLLSSPRVHVVFGLVISGFEVIKKVEGLKTDSASRPYADVRVVDCGQLFTKSANDGERSQRCLHCLMVKRYYDTGIIALVG